MDDRRDDDHIDPVACRSAGQAGRVAAPVRLRDLEAVVLTEEMLDPHPASGRHRRRGRVHDQEQAHGDESLGAAEQP